MKKYIFLFLFVPSLLFAEDSQQRDIFVREIVSVLLQTQAAHVSLNAHVEKAVEAWNHYQKLVKE
jgi:hypothetical protein